MFWFFGPKACGILVPWPGIEQALPALEGEVLTTVSPGKSPMTVLRKFRQTRNPRDAHLQRTEHLKTQREGGPLQA